MNKQQRFPRIFSSKRAMDYSLIILFIVIVTMPVLYWRMTSKMELTKKTIGEDQAIMLRAPYDKEDTTNYVEKSAQLSMPEILGAMALANGYSTPPCGGTHDKGGKKCAIINTGTKICKSNTLEAFTSYFNLYLDNYIKAYNAKSYTQLPTNNYDVHVEGNNIHAIATLPVTKGLAKRGTELDTIGTMWFAPSFTVQYNHKLDDYKKTFDALAILAQNCHKNADPSKCVSDNSHLTSGWTTATNGDKFIFEVPIGANKACYVLDLPAA